ncbi:MAG TPA: sugar-binding protein [Planctomycetia bacterium]|nr:sugar-binding protein [Planctomycetia bacterium]
MGYGTCKWGAALVAAGLLLGGCGEPAKPGSGTTKVGAATSTGDPATGAVASRNAGPTQEGPKKVHAVPEGTKLKLAFVCNNASDFWNIAKKGVEKAEKELGLQVNFYTPPGATEVEQNRFLEDLVTQGYHGVAISPIRAEAQAQDLNKVAAAMNVVTQDSDAPTSSRLAYVGTDNFAAGKALGEQIVRLLPKGGKIAVFVGMFSADNATQRLKGIEAAIAGKGIEIVEKKEDNKDEAKAATNVEDVINNKPDISLLAGLWAYNPPKIADAIKSAGKTGKILAVGFDEYDGTLDAIEAGVIDCTVVQKPYEFGYQSIKLLHDLCRKGESALPKGGIVDPGIEVVTKATVKKFREDLLKLKK